MIIYRTKVVILVIKNRILALLLTLCLLLPLAALAEEGPVLPDLARFAGDRLTAGAVEDFDFCKRVTLYGSKDDVKLVAEAYVERIMKKYDICKHAHFTNYYAEGQSRRHYALGYVGSAQVGTVGYDDENEGWQISDAAIVLTYSQFNADNYVMLTYCSEFNYKDTGDRIEASIRQSIPNAGPTPSTGTSGSADTASASVIQSDKSPSVATCRLCSGSGAYLTTCSVCKGAGVSSHTCATCDGRSSTPCSSCGGNTYTQCGSCDGHGSRSCSSCGGSGHHSSSSHHGGSHRSDSKCSSCGGDGKRSCSSCGGDGKRNCSTCRSAGRQDCPDCIGGSISSVCGGCDGSGHRNVSCNLCGGSGIIK